MDFVVFDNRNAELGEPISADLVNQNRGFLFGEGFFTTGKIKEGEVVFEDLHIQRIENSAKKLNFANFDSHSLKRVFKQAIAGVDSALFRLTITRTQEQRGYAATQPEKYLGVLQISPPLKLSNSSLSLSLSKTLASKNPSIAGIKHLNRLENVLASSEIKSPNHEVILHCDNAIVSVSKANLFVKIDGIWCTPDLSYAGVRGIMRDLVIRFFQKTNLKYCVREIATTELSQVSAAFVTNCIMGIKAVERIDSRILELDSIKPLQSSFNEFLSQVS